MQLAKEGTDFDGSYSSSSSYYPLTSLEKASELRELQ